MKITFKMPPVVPESVTMEMTFEDFKTLTTFIGNLSPIDAEEISGHRISSEAIQNFQRNNLNEMDRSLKGIKL